MDLGGTESRLVELDRSRAVPNRKHRRYEHATDIPGMALVCNVSLPADRLALLRPNTETSCG